MTKKDDKPLPIIITKEEGIYNATAVHPRIVVTGSGKTKEKALKSLFRYINKNSAKPMRNKKQK
jgi:hypothetical protein